MAGRFDDAPLRRFDRAACSDCQVRPILGRRTALRFALLGSAGAAASGLAACGPSGHTAAPSATGQPVTLTFQPYTDAYGFPNLRTLNRILTQAVQPFLARYPNIRLKMYGSTVNPLPAVLAGTGPDVPQLQGGSGGISSWLAGPEVLDLSGYIRQSNLNLRDFSVGQLTEVTQAGKVYGIPNYTGTGGVVVNQTVLDQLGLHYPSPNWDYHEWSHLAAAASGIASGGQRRIGTTINPDYFGSGPGAFYYHGWGADIVDPTNPARCGLGTPEAIACAEFLYGMVWKKSATFGWVPPSFTQGLAVMPYCWLQSYIIPAATQWNGFKWDFWPQPRWPHGSYTMTNPNFFAISAGTKHPDAAWELVRWLTVTPHWQRTLMRSVLLPPGYLPLWPEWVTVVRQVAPSLRSKNLDIFASHVKTGILYGGSRFARQDTQAKAILQKWYGRILSRVVSVKSGLTQMAAQIDALEAAAVAGTHAATAATTHPGVATLRFGPKPVASGLTLAATSGEGDSSFHLAVIGGRPAAVFARIATQPKSPISYIYMQVGLHAALKPLFAATTLYLTVEYYDAPAKGQLNAQYSSSNPKHGAYDSTPTLTTGGKPRWTSVTWKLTQAHLAGAENFGAMFRLAGTPGMAIHSVRLATRPPTAAGATGG